MVDHLDQTERVDRELNIVKRARFNQTVETYKTNEVPEPKFGVEPHTVKELPALPVRERQQDNMLLHQQLQDNMLDEEVVSFGQRAQQQQQDQQQQQLQLRQHNIPHNPVYPKQEVQSSRCHSLSSIDEASLVAIQATLAMRPVKPSIQSCYICTTCYVGFAQLFSRPSPGSYSECFIRRGCHRCSARVLKSLSWDALIYCRSQVPFKRRVIDSINPRNYHQLSPD